MTRCVCGAAILAAVVSPGCRGQEPVEAFLGYLEALQGGRGKVAWGYLARSARDRLRKEAEHLQEVTGGKVKREPYDLLLVTSIEARRSKRAIKVVETKGDRAILRVGLEAGGSAEVRLIKEEGGWKVLFGAPPASGKPPAATRSPS